MKEKTRTISMQTRLDARDICVLLEAFPDTKERTFSCVMRFYLESTVEALLKAGADKPITIADAISRIERCGFELKQLDVRNPESQRTRLAIARENMSDILGANLAEKAAASKDAELFRKLSDELNNKLNPIEGA